MLIAWQTLNKAYSPRDARFTNRFLVVTPGITIRDRLRRAARRASTTTTTTARPGAARPVGDARHGADRHHELPRVPAARRQGDAGRRRQHPQDPARRQARIDPFVETDEQVGRPGAARPRRPGPGRDRRPQRRGPPLLPGQAASSEADADADKEAKERNADARVWFRGLRAVARRVGVKAVYDLSATPFYLGGSGYKRGLHLPVGGQRLLADGRHRVRHRQGARASRSTTTPPATQVTYLHLWDHVGKRAAEEGRPSKAASTPSWVPAGRAGGRAAQPLPQLRARFAHWQRELEPLGEPPPVFIVVCPNTIVSKLVYDWIAGADVELPTTAGRGRPGNLPLLSNVDDGDVDRRAPHDPGRLRAARVRRGAEDDFKKAAAARDRGVQGRVPRCATPGPTSTSSPTRTCCAR